MAQLTIDAYYSAYEELADRQFQMPEWGTNDAGEVSHSPAPMKSNAFAMVGVTQSYGMRSLGNRIIDDNIFEGPHVTQGVAVWKVNLAQGSVLTSAYLHFYCNLVYSYNGSYPIRLYAVAEDNYVTRWLGGDYHITYWQEWQRSQVGKGGRKFRVDSHETFMRHATSQVRWTESANGVKTSPNIAAPINEVLARPGWKAGNNLALVVTPDVTDSRSTLATGFGPDWSTYPFANGGGIAGCDGSDASHNNVLSLELNY